jgi:rhamnose utilization protein RhaD (predicted bifunctional aldolase and dehydrogenase)
LTEPRSPVPGDPLVELLERSRRIGARDDLVVHGGGNTSSKTRAIDHLGRERPALLIKASGADLATLEPEGVCALWLDDLLAMRVRSAMTDEAMTAILARCLVEPASRRPSIETLLHAFLPARYVDHVHADAICALTKAPDPRAAVHEALGPDVTYVEWVRPGFALARTVAELGSSEAVVLGHHGLVTWDDELGGSERRTLKIVDRAEKWLEGRMRKADVRSKAEIDHADLLIALRGRLSRRGRRVVLHVRKSSRSISDRADVRQVADAGPATADHLMWVRPRPAVLSPRHATSSISRATSIYCRPVARCMILPRRSRSFRDWASLRPAAAPPKPV